MKPDDRFLNQSKEFWSYVRTISQEVGYTQRKTSTIKVPTQTEIREKLAELGVSTVDVFAANGEYTTLGKTLSEYFTYRAETLNNAVKPLLMSKKEATEKFKQYKHKYDPKCPLPMNKQKGTKRNYAFLTCIVNMIIEKHIDGIQCNYDPKSLTMFTSDNKPLRTLSRRVDGAFPSIIDPIAIWEIKEYYNTTTFGSRVADGVYETLLDGMELNELYNSHGKKVHHILFVDDYFTWWECGRSYLCRLIDLLNMGIVSEIIFGREVFNRLPEVASSWRAQYQSGDSH